jgi:hypothetical protein
MSCAFFCWSPAGLPNARVHKLSMASRIEDYAVIGNTCSAALVPRHGSIDCRSMRTESAFRFGATLSAIAAPFAEAACCPSECAATYPI